MALWITVTPLIIILLIKQRVVAVPTFEDDVTEVVAPQLTTAVLPCKVHDLGRYKVVWMAGGRVLLYGRRRITDDIKYSHTGDTVNEYNLQISMVTEEYEGIYQCLINSRPIKKRLVSLVVAVPPEVTISSNIEGDNINFRCDVASKIPINIVWTYRSFSADFSHAIADNQTAITVSKDRYGDGVYTCIVDNGIPPAATASYDIRIPEQPRIIFDADLIAKSVNETATVTCKIFDNAQIPPRVTWLHNDTLLLASEHYTISLTEKIGGEEGYWESVLGITNVMLTDRGSYTCKSKNEFEMTASRSVRLTVYETLSSWIVEGETVSVDQGQNITISCMIQGFPVGKIQWLKSGYVVADSRGLDSDGDQTRSNTTKYIVSNRNVSQWLAQQQSFLTVVNVTMDDAGHYECSAKDGRTGAITTSVTKIDVMYGPIIRHQTEETLYTVPGKPLSLRCAVIGNPTPYIIWQKDSMAIRDTELFMIQVKQIPGGPRISYLTTNSEENINDLVGAYECDASNRFGNARKRFIVEQAALPYPPVVESVRLTSSAVYIHLTIREQDNTPKPHTINILLQNMQDATLMQMEVDIGDNVSETTLHIMKLKANTTYRCALTTVNNVGISNPAIQSFKTPSEGVPLLDTTPIDLTVKTGQDITLACIIQNLGTKRVMWMSPENILIFLDSSRIRPDDRFTLSQNYDTDWSLTINNVKRDDRGTYRCIVNTQPLTEKHFNLIVYDSPRLVPQMSSRNIAVREGETVNLRCEFIGSPTPNITWYRNIKNDRNEAQEKLNVEGNVLIIPKITRYSDGEYRCVADNGVDPDASHTIEVKVYFSPEIQTTMERIGQYLGKETVLECTAEGNPRPDIDWFIGNSEDPLRDNWKYKILEFADFDFGKTSSLMVRDIDVNDYMNYTCQAANAEGSQRKTMWIFAVGGPAILKERSTYSITATEGVEFDLTCVATGTPAPTITWYKLDDTKENGIEIGPGSTTYQNIKRTDEGYYKCIAKNPLGEDSLEAYIKVQFPPTVEVDQDSYEQRIGDEITIICRAASNPAPSVVWRYRSEMNGRWEDLSNRKLSETYVTSRLVSSHTYETTLNIKNIKETDFGEYECAANNLLNSSAVTVKLSEIEDTTTSTTTMTTTTTSMPTTTTTTAPMTTTTTPATTTTSETTTVSNMPTTEVSMTTRKIDDSHNLKERTTEMMMTTEYKIIEKASESPVVGEDPGYNSAEKIYSFSCILITSIISSILFICVR